MAPTLWAPYGDALKLILTGSATGKLSPAQRDVFTTMLSQGQRDDNGKSGEKRHLPRINTAEYCIDEENNEFETYYYIPDVVRLMIEVHGRRSLLTLPFDQNYLNSLTEGSGEFFFGGASDYQDWLYTPEGQEYWGLILSLRKTLKKIDQLENPETKGDAKEIEARENLLDKWNNELTKITTRLNVIETRCKKKTPTASVKQTNFIPYLRAIKELQNRLNTSPEELAAWIFMGASEGGIAAYVNANELDPPPAFTYKLGNDDDFDYISPLMTCWFDMDDIANFQPADRFITGTALLERWRDVPNIVPDAFIKAKIAESRLFDIHPITGNTQGSHPDDNSLPSLESALFILEHVETIELEEFGKQYFLNTTDRDKALQHSANVLAEQWKKDGRKHIVKRDVATALATSDEWKEMTTDRIERIIRKQW